MPSKVTVSTTATLISAAKDRQLLVVQNQGATDLFLAFDQTASSVTVDSGSFPGMKLAAGNTFTFLAEAKHPIPAISGAVYGVVSSGTTTVSLQEG